MSPLKARSQLPVSPTHHNKPRKHDETFLQHSHIMRLLKAEDIEQRKVRQEVQLIVSVHLSQVKREMYRTEYKLKIKFGRKGFSCRGSGFQSFEGSLNLGEVGLSQQRSAKCIGSCSSNMEGFPCYQQSNIAEQCWAKCTAKHKHGVC